MINKTKVIMLVLIALLCSSLSTWTMSTTTAGVLSTMSHTLADDDEMKSQPFIQRTQAHPTTRDEFINICEFNQRSFRNCDCLFGKYEEVTRLNPNESFRSIMQGLRLECPDPDKVERHYFAHCPGMGHALCDCWAKGIAQGYAETPNVSGRQLRELENASMGQCRHLIN